MFFDLLTTGMFQSNIYILGDSGECAVVDCGCKVNQIMDIVNDNELTVKYIILTHGHFDHTLTVDELKKETGAKVCIHKSDANKLTSSRENGSALFMLGEKKTFEPADIELEGGERLKIGTVELEIIHTPGHSAGGISIHTGDIIFTGDTLFNGSIGRTDLVDGDMKQLISSIREKLFVYNDNTIIYPGHGPESTIGREKKTNPFFR